MTGDPAEGPQDLTSLKATQSVLDAKATPETIAASLFAGTGRLIACLDANRIRNLPTVLAASGCDHLCLFTGALAEDAPEQAPWLVSLAITDRLTRHLLQSAEGRAHHPFAYREAEAGIFLATDMPLQALRQHLRRFLRVRAQDQRYFFFRFWEPAVAEVYFTGLEDRPDLLRRWFASREGHAIDRIAITRPVEDRQSVTQLIPVDLGAATDEPQPVFTLSPGDVTRLRQHRLHEDARDLAALLAQTFPDSAGQMAPADLSGITVREMTRMMQLGFLQKSNLFLLLAWELHYGPGFEQRDRQGILAQTMTAPLPENERMALLRDRMAAFA